MQRHFGMVDEALEEFLSNRSTSKSADERPREFHIVNQTGATGKIDDHAGKGLIQGNIGMPVATNAPFVADGSVDSLSQGDSDILHRMVCVDVQIAARANVQVDQSVAGHLVQHVLQKRHADLKLASSATIQIDEDMNLSFQGIPLYLSRALRHFE